MLGLVATWLFDVSFAGGGHCLSFANALWLDQSLILKPSFERNVDFIRPLWLKWISEKRGSLGNLDRLVVFVNALHFKGAWLEKFDSSETKDYEFYLRSGRNSVKAPFTSSKKKHLIRVCDGFKVLGVPYDLPEEHCFTMYIFLPDSKDGLPSLVEKVGTRANTAILRQIKGELTEMTNSIDGEPLFVSNIIQKQVIELNEEGTESAAAIAMTLLAACPPNFKPPPEIDFVADHPFLFLIREY
ncbi:serpin-ZXA-like [Neltuma alba]|uniref:serpin-ZXA-like n=1 Tax=Neltuma alba TaxID=207710 RepID=UPI0010A2CA78|nr:serpin-ZXA-like [Prosopis alba]